MYKYWKNLANLSYGYIVYCMGIYIAVDEGSCDMERLNNSGINKIDAPYNRVVVYANGVIIEMRNATGRNF